MLWPLWELKCHYNICDKLQQWDNNQNIPCKLPSKSLKEHYLPGTPTSDTIILSIAMARPVKLNINCSYQKQRLTLEKKGRKAYYWKPLSKEDGGKVAGIKAVLGKVGGGKVSSIERIGSDSFITSLNLLAFFCVPCLAKIVISARIIVLF